MRLCLVLVFNFFAISNGNQEYVPGTPGAAWTLEEMLVVKAKLFGIFGKHGGFRTGEGTGWEHWFSERKALRLGFHDCLKYKDGSGGCDGCLNWEGMKDLNFNKSNPYGNPTTLETNNNGLAHTAVVLEKIYTDPSYPTNPSVGPFAPYLNVSLKASGKSRADLWAFAAIAALEYSIETNNMVCDGTFQNNPMVQCNYMAGKPGCRVELPRAIKFQTGRKDCTDFGAEGYIATKEESHPHLHGSGQMTVDFFVKDFGFTGRETVAIMGSHTVGRFHTIFSLMPYVWTTKGIISFNNHYYKNIVKIPQPNFEDNFCTPETLADGSLGAVKYLAFTERQTESGGPVMWVNFKHRCPNCNSDLYKDTDCCTEAPEGMQCKPDEEHDFSGLGFGHCESFNTNLGQDETALNCEVGLYLDFKVSDTGIPYGCSGLESFNNTVWKAAKRPVGWSRVPKVENPDPLNNQHWEVEEVTCPLNKLQEPLGSTPLHEVFEEYAGDQQKWVNDYVPTFEKMISNGYSDGDLTDAPDHWTDVVCPRPGLEWDPYKYHTCYKLSEISDEKSFYLVNKRTGLAIQGNDQGVAKLRTLDYDNPRQRWVHTSGQDLINMGTNLPLIITTGAGSTIGRAWKFGDENTIIESVKGKGEKALLPHHWWETKDEYDLTYFEVQDWYKNAFQFDKIMFNDANSPNSQAKYRIWSQWDQRVVEMVDDDKFRMYTMEENNANQLWFKKEVSSGFELINVGRNLPLVVKAPEVFIWVYNAEEQSLKDANPNGHGKFLKRGKRKMDGAGVGLSKAFSGGRNQFVLEMVDE